MDFRFAICDLRLRGRRSILRRGFTLVEVMFAVMILGVGFIMIAAMFPVAIQQSKANVDETTAAEIARAAAGYIEQIANNTTMPKTGTFPAPSVVDCPTNFWNAIKGNLIFPTDNRYAWTAVYRRDDGATYAQVFVVVAQCRNGSSFVPGDASPISGANLQMRSVKVDVSKADGTVPVDRVEFKTGSAVDNTAAEGAYLILNDGRVFQVGNYRADLGTTIWELVPGNDTSAYTGFTNLTGADAFILGRGWNGTAYEGLAQDISLYTTFVRVN